MGGREVFNASQFHLLVSISLSSFRGYTDFLALIFLQSSYSGMFTSLTNNKQEPAGTHINTCRPINTCRDSHHHLSRLPYHHLLGRPSNLSGLRSISAETPINTCRDSNQNLSGLPSLLVKTPITTYRDYHHQRSRFPSPPIGTPITTCWDSHYHLSGLP